jgi:hypothetical protein
MFRIKYELHTFQSETIEWSTGGKAPTSEISEPELILRQASALKIKLSVHQQINCKSNSQSPTMALVTDPFAAGAHWDTPTIDYPTFQLTFPYEGDAGKTCYQNRDALAGLSFCSPTVAAIMLNGDNHMCIAHSPSVCTPDPMNISPFDNKLVLLIGTKLESVSPIVVIEETTIRTAECHVHDMAHLTRAAGHLAGPPVAFQFATQVNGTTNTFAVRGQKICLLPPSCHAAALTNAANGCMSLLQFHAHILQGPLASAVPAEVNLFASVAAPCRLASHRLTGLPQAPLRWWARQPSRTPCHPTQPV